MYEAHADGNSYIYLLLFSANTEYVKSRWLEVALVCSFHNDAPRLRLCFRLQYLSPAYVSHAYPLERTVDKYKRISNRAQVPYVFVADSHGEIRRASV